MAFVPVVGTDTGSTPDVGASGVAPMRNYAPDQIQQTGETLQRAGLAQMRFGQNAASQIQEEMDLAQIKEADTQFIQSATSAVDEYLSKQGMDAVNSFDAASKALSKAKQDALAGLKDPVQKAKFDDVAKRHMVTLGEQMNRHRVQQSTEYAVNQSVARIDSMRTMRQNSDIGSKDQAMYAETAVEELASIFKAKGVPRDSEEFKQAERKLRSQFTVDDASRLIEDGKYQEAQTLVSEQAKAGYLEAGTADTLRKSIKAGLQLTEEISQTDKIFSPYAAKGNLRTTDLEAMLVDVGKIKDPLQREKVDGMVRHKFSEAYAVQQAKYRDNLNDVVNQLVTNGGNIRKVDPLKWGQLDPKDQYDLTPKPAPVQTDLDTWYTFATDPKALTLANVKDAYARGLLSKGDFKSFSEKAASAEKKPEYVQEASAIGDRIDYFANLNGLKVYGAQTPEDKAQIGSLKYKVMNDIDQIKAQNKGKITATEVDQVITKELTQRTISKPGWLWGTNDIQKRNFELPAGATSIVKSKADGKWHYTDGQNDLGVAE